MKLVAACLLVLGCSSPAPLPSATCVISSCYPLDATNHCGIDAGGTYTCADNVDLAWTGTPDGGVASCFNPDRECTPGLECTVTIGGKMAMGVCQ